MQQCFLPHRGTEAERQGEQAGRLVGGEGGSFPSKGLLQGPPDCLRFCRYRAPLPRARPHFSRQVKLG